MVYEARLQLQLVASPFATHSNQPQTFRPIHRTHAQSIVRYRDEERETVVACQQMHPIINTAVVRLTTLDALLVRRRGGLVGLLVDLVRGSAESTAGTAGERVVAGVALGLLLVGLLAGLGGTTLDGLRDVVDRVLGGVGDLADDALVGSVGVGGRHLEIGVWVEVGLVGMVFVWSEVM